MTTENSGSGVGTVTAPWTDFCTATFTRDFEVLNSFGDPRFTAKTGEQYLLGGFDELNGQAEIVYLADAGPESFYIEQEAAGGWPFTSSCGADAVPYYAVFTDASFYAELELTTKICDLAAGSVLPAGGGLRGYELASGISLDGPSTYRIHLDAFSAQCGGNETGYVSVPRVRVLGVYTRLVPIVSIIGPD